MAGSAARRVYAHATYTLDRAGQSLVAFAAITAAFGALGVFYPAALVILLLLLVFATPFVAAGVAASVAEELGSGEAQLYLGAGLRRREYFASWALVLTVYPALALAAGLAAPILIVNPAALASSWGIPGAPLSTAWLLAFYATAMMQAGSLSYAAAVASKSRTMVYAAVAVYMFLAPILTALYYAMTSPAQPPPELPLVMAVMNAAMAGMFASTANTSLWPVLALGLASTAAFLALGYYATRRAEV